MAMTTNAILDFAETVDMARNNETQQWQAVMPPGYQGPSMTFVAGGYDEGEPYGTVYLFDIPAQPNPVQQNAGDGFGITWGIRIPFTPKELMPR